MSGFPKEAVLLTVRELRKQCSRRLSRKVKPTRNSAPVPANVMTAEEVPNKQVLAFLGPEGTYTHQVSFLIFFFDSPSTSHAPPPPHDAGSERLFRGKCILHLLSYHRM